MKNTSYEDQFDNSGNTPVWNEAESEGLLKTARARLKAQLQGPSQPQMNLGYVWMNTCCIDK